MDSPLKLKLFTMNRMASPADLIKVHVQMEGRRRLMGLPARVNGSADALKQILQRGGVKALWKGSIPNGNYHFSRLN